LRATSKKRPSLPTGAMLYSFVLHMRDKAHQEGHDFLVVDTGDLHDGAEGNERVLVLSDRRRKKALSGITFR
jgi:hypothetical protein